MKLLFDNLLYVLFPKICFYCKYPLTIKSKEYLCDSCLSKLKYLDGLVCKLCGVPLESGGEHCSSCRKNKRKIYYNSIRGALRYEEPLITLVHNFKFNGKTFLSSYLAKFMVYFFKKNLKENFDIITCVPTSNMRKLIRGYNQTELLGMDFCKQTGSLNIFNPELLIKKKHTKPQSKLSREKRFLNLNDSFDVRKNSNLSGKNVLIIDDICTTTQTINECAKVLRQNKASKVFGIVLARC